jgi:16S rRNA (cytidine1402-2'-O)-methyltransferase
MLGNLYIVATPIGNLEDITLRAIKILSEADIILTEDTRVTKKLIDFLTANYKLPFKNLISYHQHSSDQKKFEIYRYLSEGKNIALVTDAGTPGISDPGNELIDFILKIDDKIRIVPIPGSSAIITTLSICGFNINKFIFLGFWPKKKVTKLIDLVKFIKVPFAFYESPYRILRTLKIIEANFGMETQVFVARELTKMYESVYRGTISEVIEQLQKDKVKGEMVVVVNTQNIY